MTIPAAERPKKPQTTLTVLRRETLSDHMVRIFLGGDGFDEFITNDLPDKYIKIAFFKDGVDYPKPIDLAWIRANMERVDWPTVRTYTVRWVDEAKRELAVDFVVHGDSGVAGPWALNAQPGEHVVFNGPGGAYRPDPTADWHLLLGDDSAIPAIAASAETLPDDATGHIFLEIDSPADELPFTAPAGVEVTWLHRNGVPAGESTILVDTVKATEFPEGRVHAFVHGERGMVKSLRDDLIKTRGWDRKNFSISGYWAYGRAEDQFQAEKREDIGKI